MSLEGVIVNGQVQLDSPAPLPTGTRVRVEPLPAEPGSNEARAADWKAAAARERGGRPSPLGDALLAVAGTVHDLPPDFAAQHDHYTHGAPKR